MRIRAFPGLSALAVIIAVAAPALAESQMRTGRMPGGWSGAARPPVSAPPVQMQAPVQMPMQMAPRPAAPAGWSSGGWQGGTRPTPVSSTPPAYHGGGQHGGPGGWNGNGPRPTMPPPPPGTGGPGRPTHPGGWQGGGNGHGNGHGQWAVGGHFPGGSYHRPFRGYRLPSYWISPSFYISNWSNYGLGQPGYGQNWVRYYDDAVLVDGYGSVLDTRYGMDWDRSDYRDRDDVPDYVGDGGYDSPDYDDDRGPRYDDRGPPPRYRDDAVTYGHNGSVVVHTGAGTTTVIVQSAPVVTTTVTEETVNYVQKRTWKPRAKKVWRRPACGCR